MPPTPRKTADQSETDTGQATTPEPEVTLALVNDKVDEVRAQLIAGFTEAGELFGKISQRVADLEAAQQQPSMGAPADLAARLEKLERHVTVPLDVVAPPSRPLCDDCGAPVDANGIGVHFDDCRHLPDPKPKGPRDLTAARAGIEA